MRVLTRVLAACCLLAPIAAAHAESNPSNEATGWLADDDLTTLTLRPDAPAGDVHEYRSFSLGAFQDGTEAPDTAAQGAEVQTAPAETDLGNLWTRKKLTGDWWGARSDLAKHGIDLDVRLAMYYQHVVSGGVRTNGEFGGTVDYRLNADMHKLAGLWEGLSFNLHARSRFGQDVSADAGALVLENTGLLMPRPGDYQGTDITGLVVNQMFPVGESHLGLFTFGKLDIIDAVTLFFPNVGYGQEGFWNVNSMVTALPWFGAVAGLSLYGGWVATINKEHQIGQSAILVTGTSNVTTSWSMTKSFEDGVWIAAFHRFIWELDDKLGYFMIFAGGSTKNQASNDPLDFIVVPGQGIESTEEKKPWDIALYFHQVFWQAKGDPTRKAQLMVGGTIGPDNPQFAQWNVFANVEAFGPMASRPHDRMGVSVWYNGLSDNFTDLVSPVIELTDLWGVEMYYNFEVTPWFHVTPDIQIVQNQREEDDVAVILGIRGVLDF